LNTLSITNKEIKAKKKFLLEQNRQFSTEFKELPVSYYTANMVNAPVKAFRNKSFLVQIFTFEGYTRLSINRTEIDNNGNWVDGITWDELQMIKNSVGFSNYDAVEVYPAEKNLVNVSNMRHLWIMDKPLPFIWRKISC